MRISVFKQQCKSDLRKLLERSIAELQLERCNTESELQAVNSCMFEQVVNKSELQVANSRFVGQPAANRYKFVLQVVNSCRFVEQAVNRRSLMAVGKFVLQLKEHYRLLGFLEIMLMFRKHIKRLVINVRLLKKIKKKQSNFRQKLWI